MKKQLNFLLALGDMKVVAFKDEKGCEVFAAPAAGKGKAAQSLHRIVERISN